MDATRPDAVGIGVERRHDLRGAEARSAERASSHQRRR